MLEFSSLSLPLISSVTCLVGVSVTCLVGVSVICLVGVSLTFSGGFSVCFIRSQSKARILSNVALQVGSNSNRDDPTLIEALPSCAQLCISVAKSEALTVGVPEILAR